MRAVIGALALGLPAALLFAWVWEFTPRGLRREETLAGDAADRVTASRRFDRALIALLGVALLYFVADKFWLSATDTQQADDARPSIAVLPFANRSDQADDRFFVDGIHDDVLAQLAKISALRVISRTSVERFRDTDLAVAEIATQLGATRILEGGVQRAGDRMRVTVQLIDAGTDTHLWAETYDRELSAVNLFAIQTEVATAIAAALQQALSPAEQARVAAAPTRNLEAWEAFQLGRQRMATRNSATLLEASDFLERAVALDPEFAEAHAALADTLLLLLDYTSSGGDERIVQARTHIGRALALKPDLAEAVTSAASLSEMDEDFATAEAGYQRAIALNPNYATAHHWYSGLLSRLGRSREALREAELAIRLDPLSAPLNVAMGGALRDNGRPQEALERNRKAIEIDPRMSNAYVNMAQLQAEAFARPDEAILLLRELERVDPGNAHFLDRALNHMGLEDDAAAQRLLERAAAANEWGVPFARAWLAQFQGDWEAVRMHSEQAMAEAPGSPFAQGTLRNMDLREGRAAAALARYAARWPALVSEERPLIDQANRVAALDVVPLLQAAGETAQATRVLDAVERHLATQDGQTWARISLVQLHALRGDRRAALHALREAREAGWSFGWRYFRDIDPNLASIRQEPEFRAVFAQIEAHMAALRAKLPPDPGDV
jgi:TolB-like protein/Tfp pilus assembly protein PilF